MISVEPGKISPRSSSQPAARGTSNCKARNQPTFAMIMHEFIACLRDFLHLS